MKVEPRGTDLNSFNDVAKKKLPWKSAQIKNSRAFKCDEIVWMFHTFFYIFSVMVDPLFASVFYFFIFVAVWVSSSCWKLTSGLAADETSTQSWNILQQRVHSVWETI